jgi:hypothetical protein
MALGVGSIAQSFAGHSLTQPAAEPVTLAAQVDRDLSMVRDMLDNNLTRLENFLARMEGSGGAPQRPDAPKNPRPVGVAPMLGEHTGALRTQAERFGELCARLENIA